MHRVRLKIANVLLVLLFVVGLAILLYPFVANWYYQNHADEQLSDYRTTVSAGDAEAYAKAFDEAHEFNQILVGQTVPDVFAIREGMTDKDYERRLNVAGDLMMGYIEIPAISVRLPIFHYSDEKSLEKGCGHIFGSSLPVGGADSHAVITAHRGLPAAKLFTDLDQLLIGDRFFLKILDRTLAYEVDNIEVVEPTDTRSLAIERGQDYVTLVTCTPYGVNTDRLLVRGHRIDYVEGDETTVVDTGFHAKRLLWILVQVGTVAAAVGVVALGMWLFNRRQRNKARERFKGCWGALGGGGDVHALHDAASTQNLVADRKEGNKGGTGKHGRTHG